MYYLNKIVGWLFSPMGLLFVGLGCSWALHALSRCCRSTDQKFAVDAGKLKPVPQGMGRGERCLLKASRWVCGLTLALTWVFGCGITTRLIGLGLEGEESRLEGDVDVCADVDALVLLGGGMGAHERCGRPEMFSGADRVWCAAKLWHAGLRLFCTGGGVEQSTVPLLVDLGVDPAAIACLADARNTAEEATEIAAALAPDRATSPRIALVTSAWHMPRARLLFERAGFTVVPCPTDYEMHYAAEEPIGIGDFFPSAEALQRNSCAVKEWVARFCYWLKR